MSSKLIETSLEISEELNGSAELKQIQRPNTSQIDVGIADEPAPGDPVFGKRLVCVTPKLRGGTDAEVVSHDLCGDHIVAVEQAQRTIFRPSWPWDECLQGPVGQSASLGAAVLFYTVRGALE